MLIDHTSWVFNASFSPDSKSFVSCSVGGTVIVWDTETRQPKLELETGGDTYVVMFLHGHPQLLGAGDDTGLYVWDISGEKHKELLNEMLDHRVY